MKKIMKIGPTLFRILSFTWGLPQTLIGAVVALGCLFTGHKPKRWGPCFYFEVGKKNWGGCEYGLFFLKDRSQSDRLRYHELGHGLQNCLLGPFMPFVVSFPSSIRYWYRRIRNKRGKPSKTEYDSVWFEGQATRLGKAYIERYYPDLLRKP